MNRNEIQKNPPAHSGRKLLLVVLTLVLLIALGAGVTMAYFANASGPLTNTFRPGSVGAKIGERFDGSTKTAITVTNTGASPAYVRVRLVSYWVDGKNNPVAKSSVLPAFTMGDNWQKVGDYYYYKAPLAGNATTTNLLASSITLSVEDGAKQVVEVLTDSVQASPANAAKEVWGMTFDIGAKTWSSMS